MEKRNISVWQSKNVQVTGYVNNASVWNCGLGLHTTEKLEAARMLGISWNGKV